jgi:hypothetical protein
MACKRDLQYGIAAPFRTSRRQTTRIATFLSRPCVQTLVIGNTRSRPPFKPAPIQASLAAVIFPAIVKERNTAIHGLPYKAYCGGLVGCIPG